MTKTPDLQIDTKNDPLYTRLTEEGYSHIRILPDGTYAGISRLAFTVAVYTGLTDISWSRRFCYQNLNDAKAGLEQLEAWNSEPEPVYIARRPE